MHTLSSNRKAIVWILVSHTGLTCWLAFFPSAPPVSIRHLDMWSRCGWILVNFSKWITLTFITFMTFFILFLIYRLDLNLHACWSVVSTSKIHEVSARHWACCDVPSIFISVLCFYCSVAFYLHCFSEWPMIAMILSQHTGFSHGQNPVTGLPSDARLPLCHYSFSRQWLIHNMD